MRTRKAPGRLTPESIAGWVLADILIVLFIVALGAIVPPAIEAAPPAVSPTPTPPPTPPPIPKPRSTKPTKTIVGMKTKPAVFQVSFDDRTILRGGKAGRAAKRSVCHSIDKRSSALSGQRAALVLIFAGGSDVESAQRNAKALGRQLSCANAVIFGGTPVRPFWDGGLPAGKARLEVFLFTTGKAR